MPLILPCLAALPIMLAVAAPAAEATTSVRVASAYWATREGISARVLSLIPARPRAGVMLLPGGHGNINLSSQAQIGWGHDDFVVRTRAVYAQADFFTIVPDVAIDRKPPADLGDYRRSPLQAHDLLAISGRLQRAVKKLFLVAYDRGATSALNAVARGRTDSISGLVLISPILEPAGSVLDDGAKLAFAKLPVLLISHASDECSAGAASHLKEIAAAAAAQNFQAVSVTGGSDRYQLQDPLAYYQDSCNKKAPHAMAGLEGQVSNIVMQWLLKSGDL